MKNSARNSPGLSLCAVVVVATMFAGCFGSSGTPKTDSMTARSSAGVETGIPAPPEGLTDASPVTDFRQYGDSLLFADDTSGGSVLVNRPVPGGTSQLRISSEVRLPLTSGPAYTRGRIIARFQTITAGSAYNTPVGSAYLWVRDTGGGNFVGTLMYLNAATGDTGRVTVPSHMHSAPRNSGVVADCVDLDPGSDTTRACCLCGGGQYNCPFSAITTMQQMEALLTRAGRAPRP